MTACRAGQFGNDTAASPGRALVRINPGRTRQWRTVFVPGARASQAAPSTDYVPASGTLTFTAGVREEDATILVNGGLTVLPDGYFVVQCGNPTNATMGGFWGLGFGGITWRTSGRRIPIRQFSGGAATKGTGPGPVLDLHQGAGFMLQGVDDLMTIGEFSERSGLSPKRLRSYAASGLLVPAAVDSTSGYRYYSPGQLRQAQLIDVLRNGGVPLAEIGSLLWDPSAQRLDVWARQVEVEATQRREALDVARHLLVTAAEPSASDHDEHERNGSMTKLRTAARTDAGRVRDNNEDAVVSLEGLVAVADGMGGAPGGEVASTVAMALVESAFTGRSLDELKAAVRAANRTIWDRAGASAELAGMGTTVCAVGLTEDGGLAVVNVGDSRAYLWRDGSLRQLTDDHSVTAELVRRGELTERDAADHPHRGILTRALGVGPTVEIDDATHLARTGDRLLVCTDGLFNEVPHEKMASVMATTEDIRAAADALVQLALSNGGRDNVSVVVAEVCSSS